MKKTISYLTLLMFAVLMYGPILPAQEVDQTEQREAELAMAESFRAGFQEIVDDLNSGSFERFTNAIDQPAMLERIFALRLINQRIKKQFRENFEFAIEPMVKALLTSGDDGAKATLLNIDSRGDFGRATVRYELPNFQYNYHEYDLRLNRHGGVVIVDWTDFLQGEKFSDGLGETLIMAAPSDPAVRKLLDFKNARPRHIFQMAQLLKAARDHDVNRYFEILESLDEQLQRQRIALARAMVMDPDILIYDEPFVGLDPISMGVIVRLVRQMNDALGISSILVSHDVQEIAAVADCSYLIADGKVAASGSPDELSNTSSEVVKQFMHGMADGPVAFHYAAPNYAEPLLGRDVE